MCPSSTALSSVRYAVGSSFLRGLQCVTVYVRLPGFSPPLQLSYVQLSYLQTILGFLFTRSPGCHSLRPELIARTQPSFAVVKLTGLLVAAVETDQECRDSSCDVAQQSPSGLQMCCISVMQLRKSQSVISPSRASVTDE